MNKEEKIQFIAEQLADLMSTEDLVKYFIRIQIQEFSKDSDKEIDEMYTKLNGDEINE